VNDAVKQAMGRMLATVKKYYPDVEHAARAAATVCAVRCIANNTQPTSLIYVGPPSSGKSMVLEWLTPQADIPDGAPDDDDDGEPDDDPLTPYFHRSDKFTAASFVSQHGDTKKKHLGDVDLLPKIKDKTLITPELAPVFAGRREDFIERMSMLVKVLDGQGLVTDAGTHGSRGYAKPHNFQWLGATTPVSPEVLAAMSKLGPRILYYEIVDRADDNATLLGLIDDGADNERAKRACRAAMVQYVLTLYREHPCASLHTSRIVVAPHLQLQLVEWARALCGLRVGVKVSKEAPDGIEDYEDSTPRLELVDKPERPFRALGNLNRIVRASAIAHGRTTATTYDLAMIRHIVLSSGIGARGRAFAAVLAAGGAASTADMMEHMGATRNTALRYMRELAVTGLVTIVEKGQGKKTGIQIADHLKDLVTAPQYREGSITNDATPESATEILREGREPDTGRRPEDSLSDDVGPDPTDD